MVLASERRARFPLLTAAILLPLVGAIAIALVSKRRPEVLRLVALLFSGADRRVHRCGCSPPSTATTPASSSSPTHEWIEEFGIQLAPRRRRHLAVPRRAHRRAVPAHASWPSPRRRTPRRTTPGCCVLEAGCIGAFTSLDLFLFFIFFEIVLVPMYFLIGGWGYGERVYAALKFFLYTMFGSALMLVGILVPGLRRPRRDASAARTGPPGAGRRSRATSTSSSTPASQVDPADLARIDELAGQLDGGDQLTFDLVDIAESRGATPRGPAGRRSSPAPSRRPDANSWNPLHWGAAKWIFLAFALAFAVKVPLFPLHTWLPDAHTQAPTAGSVILAGVMLKLGTYGFIRFGLYLFPDATTFFAPVFLTLGVIGIIYGAVVATMQKDLKRLVAYSSVAHLGFIALGTFALTTQGIEGGILQMVNHGISTGALFLLLGMIYERRHTYEIATHVGHAEVGADPGRRVHAGDAVSSIGLPGLNGFVGEFLILAGAYLTAKWWAVVAAGGVILAALYLLWAYQRVFHGEPAEDDLETAGHEARRVRRDGPAHRPHRVHGRLPQAGARAHRAVGHRAGRATSRAPPTTSNPTPPPPGFNGTIVDAPRRRRGDTAEADEPRRRRRRRTDDVAASPPLAAAAAERRRGRSTPSPTPRSSGSPLVPLLVLDRRRPGPDARHRAHPLEGRSTASTRWSPRCAAIAAAVTHLAAVGAGPGRRPRPVHRRRPAHSASTASRCSSPW